MTNRITTPPEARTVIVGVETHKHVHVAVAIRGGPLFSDRLLRWSPDPTGGIWNATQETELPG